MIRVPTFYVSENELADQLGKALLDGTILGYGMLKVSINLVSAPS